MVIICLPLVYNQCPDNFSFGTHPQLNDTIIFLQRYTYLEVETKVEVNFSRPGLCFLLELFCKDIPRGGNKSRNQF